MDLSSYKAIILDKDGVFVDFNKLWFRVIAARAQILAEMTTETWESFNLVRSSLIRAMGVDEEDELLDPHSPISMPFDLVKVACITALYLSVNSYNPDYNWQQARKDFDQSSKMILEDLDFTAMTESIEGSIETINKLAETSILAIYSSDSHSNCKIALNKFEITKHIQGTRAGEYKTADGYQQLCNEIGVKAKDTLFITDSPVDVDVADKAGAQSLLLLSGVTNKEEAQKVQTKYSSLIAVISSISDIYMASAK